MLRLKKMLSLLLAMLLLIPFVPLAAAETENLYSDINGHWAKNAILRWSEMGILKGNGGKFDPNGKITRGTLATLINNVMKFPATEAELFTDTKGKWYEVDINALAWQGVYIESHGLAKGDAVLTREEAVYMMANCFLISGTNTNAVNKFTDASDISEHMRGNIGAMLTKGFISGKPDGRFDPKGSFTRAEVVTMLDNMIDYYITKSGVYTEDLGKNVFIAAPNVSLPGYKITNLWLSPCATAGDATVTSNDVSPTYVYYWRHAGNQYIRKNTDAVPSTQSKYLRSDIDKRFAGGYGLNWSPYLIENQVQLKLLGEYLGTSSNMYTFKLAKDIALSGKWESIGNYTGYITYNETFHGTLDGNGHKITGLDVDIRQPDEISAGLFADYAVLLKTLQYRVR